MTTTDLTVVPITGEALDLPGMTAQQLGEVFDQAQDYKRQFDSLQLAISDEVLRRMDRATEWTIHAGTVTFTGKSPEAHTDYPLDELRATLDQLIAEGLLSNEQAESAIRTVIKYEPSKTGINKLLKLGGQVKARLEAIKQPIPRPRRVSVKREIA